VSACISEPVSWLRLERLRLGELPEAERAAIAAHLAACAACAACAERIEADEATELPPLEVRAPRASEGARAAPSRVHRLSARAGVLAAAAAVVLAVGHAWRTPDRGETGAGETGHARSKGDGMAFTLVRDDGEPLVEAQGVFRDGDRFKALVTCPPGMSASFDLVVFDPGGEMGPAAGGVSFPLAPARRLSCGNDVPLPGAFRLTGSEDETVCVVWREDGEVDRGALSRSGEVTDRRAMCKELRPAGPR
jgi:Putative zinc-finger